MITPISQQKEDDNEKTMIELYFNCILTPLENEEDAKKLNDRLRLSIGFGIYDDNEQFLFFYRKLKACIYKAQENIGKENLCKSLCFLHSFPGNLYPWLEKLLAYTVIQTYGKEAYENIWKRSI